MSYLEKLIDRATSGDLENNQIGNYRITPQHGANVYVYHIFKIDATYLPTGRKYRGGHQQHVATIDIVFMEVRVTVNMNYLTKKEVSTIKEVLTKIYDDRKIVVEEA